MKLEIQDKTGKVIEEDNLDVREGDILVFQLTEHMPPEPIKKSIRHFFDHYNKNNSINKMILPVSLNLKVLKIKT